MRLTLALLSAFLCVSYSPAQVWEKSLAPGMTYRFEFEPMLPRIVHSVRVAPSAPGLKVMPALPKKTVYANGPTKGRGTVTEMVRSEGAMGGVNADFFPWTGDPLGLMIKSGQLVSAPNPSRAAFAWGTGGASGLLASFKGTLIGSKGELEFAGWNEDPGLNRASLFTQTGGLAVCKAPSLHFVFETAEQEFAPNGEFKATLKSILADAGDLPVAPGTVVIAANGTAMEPYRALATGETVTLRNRVEGFDPAQYDQAVGGGPFLIRNDKIEIDAESQKFNDGFSKSRHPRTAVGKTAEGDLVFVVVDGRQPMSVGASLEEMAAIMRRLQCVDAINLDGGGSSSLNLRGLTLNRPSDGSERAVANGVAFFAPEPPLSTAEIRLQASAKQALNSSQQLSLRNPDGSEIPHAEILWAAQGAAWIDQGGLLRGFKDGVADVTAFCRGKAVKVQVQIGKGNPPPKPPKPVGQKQVKPKLPG